MKVEPEKCETPAENTQDETLVCPFCQQELKYDAWNEVYMCRNPNCKHLLGFGTKELWATLIRTCKALDVALDAIDKGEAALIGCQEADDKHISDVTAEDGLELMHKAYKQITALEQKDVK